MSGGLTPEEKEQALYAARAGVVELITSRPDLARFDADDLVTIYLAGVRAGADAAARVMDVVQRRQLGEES